MSYTNDPISVTAYLRDLVRVFVEGSGEVYDDNCEKTRIQNKKEVEAINNCFQLFLGRDSTDDETARVMPW